MPFNQAIQDREHDKFVECPTGETAVRVCVANDSGDPVIVSGSTSAAAPTGPFRTTTVVSVNPTPTDPIPTPLADRVSGIVRNKSSLNAVYFSEDILHTADDTATGAWEIGPGEDFAFNLSPDNGFFLFTEAGKTAVVKILELASTASGGGGGMSGTPIQEIPSGTVNGINTTFTLTQTPIGAAYLQLFLDGVFQRVGVHYTRSGTTITMIVAPEVGQSLDAVYWY